ncbi:hypothetical protein RJT34_12576 [Clitoria ternatea]|uniref:BZIP domain-containing protein n=1 Tax=Clitoria ternatea TaxID=43366 RepID=A0AAN9JQK2_CLITE
MGELLEKNCLASLEDQSCLEKSPTFNFMGPSTQLIGGASSSFHASLGKSHCDAEENTTNLELDLKIGISNAYSAQVDDNHYKNCNLDDQVIEKDFLNGQFATPGVGVNFNINPIHEGQASQPDLDLKVAMETTEDDQRLKRLAANRSYSKKYRMKKMLYIEHLENLTRALMLKNSNMRLQIQHNKHVHHFLMSEQHQLKLKAAAYANDGIMKEVEIGKKIAEVNRLRALQMNQLQAKDTPTHNLNVGSLAIDAQFRLR